MPNYNPADAAKHIVHDYVYLVVAGNDTQRVLPYPFNHYAERTFLVHCRGLGKFFSDKGRPTDLYARDFVNKPLERKLSMWDHWHDHIDKHLAHLTEARLRNTREWTGKNNKAMLEEFEKMWHDFYASLLPSVKPSFDEAINEIQTDFPGVFVEQSTATNTNRVALRGAV